VKLKEPKDRAAAKALDEDEAVEGRSGMVGDVDSATVEIDETLWEEP
jgi:hypothetical protein